MGYEIAIACILCGVISGSICYEVGYLRGMLFAEKNYEEEIEMNDRIFELQDKTIQTYKEVVNELRVQLLKQNEDVQEDKDGKQKKEIIKMINDISGKYSFYRNEP